MTTTLTILAIIQSLAILLLIAWGWTGWDSYRDEVSRSHREDKYLQSLESSTDDWKDN